MTTPLPPELGLPPEDRQASPHTGWVRGHWEATADGLLAALARHATPHHGQIHPPGGRPSQHGRASDGLEGYARSFLLAAFRLAGSNGAAPGHLAERYARGLEAGTDPAHSEAWPAIGPLSQPMVEAASVAIGLFETRPWLWDALSDGARQRAVDWLSGSLGQRHWPNNWLLFQVIVNAFLASVGAPHDATEIERDLDLVDSMYRSDGWYTDGPGHGYDHYVGWAMHLYPVLWARMGGAASDPDRVARHRMRLRRYLEDVPHLFAADGAPLFQGRSLIYRFAAAAPLFAGALAGATPLEPGATRRAASGALRHFLERGALRDGVLTMGWHREFPAMAQAYSGPASPYWASKAFLGLLLPEDDPVWTEREQPLPVERGDFCRAMPEPGFLAQGTVSDGIVRVFNHKSDHVPMPGSVDGGPFYRKLAYSTHTGPDLPEGALDVDSQVALISRDGDATRRGRIHPIGVVDRMAASAFYPLEATVVEGRHFPLWLERIETFSIAWAGAEIRIHHASAFGSRRLRDAGFAVAAEEPLESETGDGWCVVRRADARLASGIFSLHGVFEAEPHRAEAQNPFGLHSATPTLTTTDEIAVEQVCASLVVLSGAGLDPRTWLAKRPRVRVHGREVEIECPDGECFFVQLVAPEPVARELGGRPLVGPVRYARRSSSDDEFVWSLPR